LRELRKDEVACEVSVGVVHFLEVVDVEHEERQGRAMTAAERDLLLEAIEEVLLVERLREVVAERGVVHRALEVFFELVVIRELEDGRRAELDLVAVFQRARLDERAIHERSVRAAQILYFYAGSLHDDLRVTA